MGYRWNQPAYSLSYANRRRLEIARAMATKPRILLLDEPAAGMNPVETHEITELIGQLRDEGGYTILVIEHDMHVVEGISDRVIALDHGDKIAEGSFEQVATNASGSSRRTSARRRRSRSERDERPSRCSSSTRSTRTTARSTSSRTLARRRAGELVCLLGGNASGKSTTLKTILGIVRPRTGTVQFDGEDVTDRSTSYRIGKGMAIVPENRRLFGPMTVLENLEMGAYLHGGGTKEDFDRVYELFPLLHERRNQLAGTLSGGEQQMVAMGRALMSRPKLLLMDEPSMGLAPILVERSFEIISRCTRRASRSSSSSRTRTCRCRSPTAATSCRPAGSCSRARPPTCSRTRSCARPTWAVTRRGGDPRRVPDLRAHDVPQLVLAGRPFEPFPQPTRTTSTAGMSVEPNGRTGSSAPRLHEPRSRAC